MGKKAGIEPALLFKEKSLGDPGTIGYMLGSTRPAIL
jgi:hypothetical protein